MNKMLIILEGQGDTEVKFIDAEWEEWLSTPPDFPPGHTSLTELAPDGSKISVTTGSWENDRAIQIGMSGLRFDSVTDALDHAVKQGWAVTCQYCGCIY